MSLYARILASTRSPALAVNGDDFTYQPVAGLPVIIRGILQPQASLEGVNNAFEVLWVQRSQFSFTPAQGGSVEVNGAAYVIHDVKPDETPGSEGIFLYLNRRKSNA